MEKKQKRRGLIWIGIVLGAMVLLATSLSNISFQPGQTFQLPTQSEYTVTASPTLNAGFIYWIFRGILALVIALLPLVILYLLFTKDGRERLVNMLITLLVVFLILTYLTRNTSPNQEGIKVDMGSSAVATQAVGPATPVEFDASPPRWADVAATLGLGLLLGGVTYFLIRRFVLRPNAEALAVDPIAEQAQAAISALESGQNLKDTIQKCYREMSRVLQEEQGIQRGPSMTPTEFESQLAQRGLPQSAIRNLTRLFEDVRYGAHQPGSREEQLAISSLSAIVAACRRAE
jgi:hypothetical protein